MKRYDQALAGFNELISKYADYAEAHRGRAYILATCPDPKLRNGKEALRSATRACELTTWREIVAVSTLAAAYAEAGDFANAVVWQQKGIQTPTNSSGESGHPQTRHNARGAGVPLADIRTTEVYSSEKRRMRKWRRGASTSALRDARASEVHRLSRFQCGSLAKRLKPDRNPACQRMSNLGQWVSESL